MLYRVKIYTDNETLYENVESTEEEMKTNIVKYVGKYKDSFPHSIVSDAVEHGSAACWCGTQSFGYKVAKITEDNEYVNYIFNNN